MTDRLDRQTLENRSSEVAGLMRALANERRLLILCKLTEWGEANVTSLTEAVGLSQSALSQHLALMREEGVVTFRRESQTLWYRIADPRVERVMEALYNIFCAPARLATSEARKLRRERDAAAGNRQCGEPCGEDGRGTRSTRSKRSKPARRFQSKQRRKTG